MARTAHGPADADQAAYWNGEVGDRWVALQEALDAAFEPLAAATLEVAAPTPGERVLDIGCGTGATVMALARRVGPGGTVLGVDISRPMLARAERRIAQAGTANARVLLADAGAPLPDGPFDLIFSRFGVMFFLDPVSAFRAIRGGAAPGGRLAFACWQPMAANPWFSVPTEAIRRSLAGPAPDADPLAPGPFAFADPDRVRSILEAAGFAAVEIVPRGAALPLGTVAEAAFLVSEIGPASRALGEAAPDQRPDLEAALAQELAARAAPDGTVRLAGAIWVVTARAGVR